MLFRTSVPALVLLKGTGPGYPPWDLKSNGRKPLFDQIYDKSRQIGSFLFFYQKKSPRGEFNWETLPVDHVGIGYDQAGLSLAEYFG